jgi:VanZ family protein
LRLRRLLVVVWVLATFALALGLGANAITEALVVPPLLSLGVPSLWAWRAHRVLRKCGHLVGYAVFALLLRWALEGVPHRARWALLAALVLAVIDEGLQALAGSRGGSLLDVLLDVGAAGLALHWAERRAARARGAGGEPAGPGAAPPR